MLRFSSVCAAVSVKSHLQRGPGRGSLAHIQEGGCQHSSESHSSGLFLGLNAPLCVSVEHLSHTHTHTPGHNTHRGAQQSACGLRLVWLPIDWLTDQSSCSQLSPAYKSVVTQTVYYLFPLLRGHILRLVLFIFFCAHCQTYSPG